MCWCDFIATTRHHCRNTTKKNWNRRAHQNWRLLQHKLQSEYQELRRQCQDFATALLDHTRTSNELEVMLNHDPTNLSGPMFEHGERMHLNRLKLAIKLRQKKVWFPFSTLIIHEHWTHTHNPYIFIVCVSLMSQCVWYCVCTYNEYFCDWTLRLRHQCQWRPDKRRWWKRSRKVHAHTSRTHSQKHKQFHQVISFARSWINIPNLL